jgi:MFS family permease
MAPTSLSRAQVQVAVTAFAALFSIVGLALYGLPFFYDFMVTEFGWSRTQVTSGNAYSKLLIGPLFGFSAGWLVDRFGPRWLMLAGIAMAGIALIGLGSLISVSAAAVPSSRYWLCFSSTASAGSRRCRSLVFSSLRSRCRSPGW